MTPEATQPATQPPTQPDDKTETRTVERKGRVMTQTQEITMSFWTSSAFTGPDLGMEPMTQPGRIVEAARRASVR